MVEVNPNLQRCEQATIQQVFPMTECNCFHTTPTATLRGPPPAYCYLAHSSIP